MTRLILGDCVEMLKTLEDGSVHTCVTSPPYWGLRDYGCDGQIGLEATPDAFVGRMVEVFREVRRVLRDDGTLWLNLGDSYATRGGESQPHRNNSGGFGGSDGKRTQSYALAGGGFERPATPGLKPKDLCGIPWRVAFALQADGYYLRSDIVWHKPNPMPESVRDRPTKSHEYLFLLSKNERYFWDAEAVREPLSDSTMQRWGKGGRRFEGHDDYFKGRDGGRKHIGQLGDSGLPPSGSRNIRSVWTIPTKSYRGAHFATFPPKLVEPCIKAGCPVGGVVLDPFAGSGTTGAVAVELGRSFVGIELNPAYLALAEARLAEARPDHPLFAGVAS